MKQPTSILSNWVYTSAIQVFNYLVFFGAKLIPANAGIRRNKMRRSIFLVFGVATLAIGALFVIDNLGLLQSKAQTLTIPDVVTLGKEVKLGPVTFNHADHTTKNYNVAGDGPIACTECHHTAQPTAEVTKNALWKTSWPADRTTSLTKEVFTKDPAASGAVSCRGCHARTGETPKLLPKIPEITLTGSKTPTAINNMQAFHRRCIDCHKEVVKLRPTTKGPTTAQCTMCHKKAA